jgi:hypothetical protein
MTTTRNTTGTVTTGTVTPETASTRTEPLALAGFVLGIVSLLAWLIPLVGAPVAVVGLVLSAVGRSKVARTGARNGTQAAVGIVLSVVGLVLSIGNAALGAYLAMS